MIFLVNRRPDGSVEVAGLGGFHKIYAAEEWRALLNACVDELRETYGPVAEALRPPQPR